MALSPARVSPSSATATSALCRSLPSSVSSFCLANLLGLVPGFESPTASPVVPLGVALLTFVYYNFYGFKEQGPVGYVKHFMGPVWWIAPLLFPIEIISHLARILSLTVRLYANMFAGDLVTLAFFSLVPIGIPVVFFGLHFGVALIQAYVFMVLGMIYMSQAVAHEALKSSQDMPADPLPFRSGMPFSVRAQFGEVNHPLAANQTQEARSNNA